MPLSSNWLPVFLHFISLLRITSKEATEPVPIVPYEAQKRLLEVLHEGLNEGVHYFVNLKARQLGISTILLALDIFWLYMHPGLQGALIADTAENKEVFRATLSEMLESLPPGFRVSVKSHNRTSLILSNGSRLQYMSAGRTKNSGLGRSRGLNYIHATEASSWGDQKGLDSLIAALAEENPNRLYVFESTALGYNLFYDLCNRARSDSDKRFCFIGWWAKEVYRLPEFKDGDFNPEFMDWWGKYPMMTPDEEVTHRAVLEQYGHDIVPEQWAWHRKNSADRSEASFKEEFPSTEQEAFQATGSSFFSPNRITKDLELIRAAGLAFDGYKYILGDTFTSMRVQKVTTVEDTDLRIWEEPKPNGRYAIGVDPTYGRSATADRGVVSVWRCFSDKLVQVAEYATPKVETFQIAWVLSHLAGCYKDCLINLEISGPGQSVMHEMEHIRHQINFGELRETAQGMGIADALDRARWFLYPRPQAVGPGYTWNWTTTNDKKLSMLNGVRDAYNTEQLIVRSVPLLGEMTTLVQNGMSIGASGRNKDDRVFATGLAHYAWARWIRAPLMADSRTFTKEMRLQSEREVVTGRVVENLIPNFFRQKAAERNEAELRRLLEGDTY